MSRILKPSILFTSLIVVVTLLFLVSARQFSLHVMAYPWVIQGSALVVSVWLLVVDIWRAATGRAAKQGAGMDIDYDADYSLSDGRARVRFIRTIAWLVGLYVAIWLFGFKISAVSFIVAYANLEGRTRWYWSIVITALTILFLVYFDLFLGAFWPEGVLKEWLPWLP